MKKEEVVRLFDLYSDDLYRFAVSYVGSRFDAEDIVQEVFLKLLDKHLLFDLKNEKAYLMTMTANKCKDLLRSSARHNNVDIESCELQLQYSDLVEGDHNDIFDELMKLEEAYRLPIYLFYYSGYSYKEIATILKLSESAVAMRIQRGKEKIRFKLEE